MLLEGGLLHGGVVALRTFEPHRRFRRVTPQHVGLQLKFGDASEVALSALEVFLEVDAVHPLLVHVGHVPHEPHADGSRKITEHTLQDNHTFGFEPANKQLFSLPYARLRHQCAVSCGGPSRLCS